MIKYFVILTTRYYTHHEMSIMHILDDGIEAILKLSGLHLGSWVIDFHRSMSEKSCFLKISY